MASTTEYTVTGMTCQHCVNAVAEEIGGIDGVTGVDVDLDSGQQVELAIALPVPVIAMVPPLQFTYWQWLSLVLAAFGWSLHALFLGSPACPG